MRSEIFLLSSLKFLLLSFTSLLCSPALKHQPPFFRHKKLSDLFLFLCLSHNTLFKHFRCLNIPLLLTPLAGRGLPSLQLSLDLHLVHCTAFIYIALLPSHLFVPVLRKIAFPLVLHTNTHALRQLGRLGTRRPSPQAQRRE